MAHPAFTNPNPFGAGINQVKEDHASSDPMAGPGAGLFANNASPFSSNQTFGSGPAGNFPSTSSSGHPRPHHSLQVHPADFNMNRRTSVSAESLTPTGNIADSNWKPPLHPKSDEQLQRLRQSISHNFLFSGLDDESSTLVLGALVEKPIPAKDIRVIVQGDAGDFFYVVERGTFDIFVNPVGHVEPGPNGMGEKVSSIGPGGSFGELALMYNAPRAATVVSTEANSTLWALDRVTFRRILMDNAYGRRRMYERFLEEVPLLSELTLYERSKIADALDTQKFTVGSTIIQEGEPGHEFFFLETGEAVAYKSTVGNGKEPVRRYKKGDYFGELALLDDKPRAASVVASGSEGDIVKVAYLGKQGFQRLLGPVEAIMRRNDYSAPSQ